MKLLERIETVYNMGSLRGLWYIGRNYLFTKQLPLHVLPYPRSIQIEPTARCNLSCRMCYYNAIKRKQGGMLSLEDFKKIIVTNFNYFHIVRLWGIGEPLLNPDIFEMIRFEKERNNIVNLSTNGMLLNGQNIKKLIDSKLDKLNISIDSVLPKEYEYIRRGASFATLKKNLTNLYELQKQSISPLKVSVTTVVMRSNIHKLIDFIPFLKKYGIQRMSIQMIQLNRSGIEFTQKEDIKSLNNTIQDLHRYEAHFKNEGITLSVPEINLSGLRKNCLWPWLETYITYDGYITSCCRNIDMSHYTCGNIFQEDFKSIWNNEKYQTFRKLLRENTLPKLCQDCTML